MPNGNRAANQHTLRPLVLVAAAAMMPLYGCSDARVNQIEQQVKQLRTDLMDLRTLQAQHSSDLSQMRTEIRQLSGRMEEVQHVSVGKTRELEETLTQLKSRVPPPAGVPEDLLAQDEERIAAVTGAAADSYRAALNMIRTGDFAGAANGFTVFTQQNPNTAFTDNGLFWLGLANEKLGRYDQAVVAYSEVFQRYSAEDMVAPALYYLAECFVKMGSRNEAVLTLQKLVDEHGRAPYGVKGRQRLAELQGPPSRQPSGGRKRTR